MIIKTLDGSVGVPDRWLAFVSRELRAPDRFIIVDDGHGDSYAQAFNDHGNLLLEYRDGSPQRHFQVTGVKLAHVADALSQWAQGDRTFVDEHEWTRLRDWDQSP